MRKSWDSKPGVSVSSFLPLRYHMDPYRPAGSSADFVQRFESWLASVPQTVTPRRCSWAGRQVAAPEPSLLQWQEFNVFAGLF